MEWGGTALLVGGGTAAALAGLAAARRPGRLAYYRAHHDQVVVAVELVALVFAVVTGLMLVAAWERTVDAERAAAAEFAALRNVVRLTAAFPPPEREALQAAALGYGRLVLEREWPAMARGAAPAPEVVAAFGGLFGGYLALNGTGFGATAAYGAALDELDDLDDARGERVLASQIRLPPFLWVCLVAAAGLMVGLTWLLGVRDFWLHGLLVGAVAFAAALLLAAVAAVDRPFGPPLGVSPAPYAARLARAEAEVAAARGGASAPPGPATPGP
jgi:hypothetical protein